MQLSKMVEALQWIAHVAEKAAKVDPKLRAEGLRSFRRIGERARAALDGTDGAEMLAQAKALDTASLELNKAAARSERRASARGAKS